MEALVPYASGYLGYLPVKHCYLPLKPAETRTGMLAVVDDVMLMRTVCGFLNRCANLII
jgi:hypothetical protein